MIFAMIKSTTSPVLIPQGFYIEIMNADQGPVHPVSVSCDLEIYSRSSISIDSLIASLLVGLFISSIDWLID